MKTYLREARKAARKGTARPFQLEYILNEPGDTPHKIVASCELVANMFKKVFDSGENADELNYALYFIEQCKAKRPRRSMTPVRYAIVDLYILDTLKALYPKYHDRIFQIEDNAYQCKKQRREFIDFLNATRSPYSRPISYNDRSI